MGALLGYVVDIVVGAVMEMNEIDNVMKSRVMRALNKVVWIQNDLFARHYIGKVEVDTITPPPEVTEGLTEGAKESCPFSG